MMRPRGEFDHPRLVRCPECGTTGQIIVQHRLLGLIVVDCPRCGGFGWVSR